MSNHSHNITREICINCSHSKEIYDEMFGRELFCYLHGYPCEQIKVCNDIESYGCVEHRMDLYRLLTEEITSADPGTPLYKK